MMNMFTSQRRQEVLKHGPYTLHQGTTVEDRARTVNEPPSPPPCSGPVRVRTPRRGRGREGGLDAGEKELKKKNMNKNTVQRQVYAWAVGNGWTSYGLLGF